MAIANLALPINSGRFEAISGYPTQTAIQTVEVAANLFFNMVEQREPNHAFVYLSDQNPTTLVHTANVALQAPNQNSIVEASKLFKVASNKVLAILGVTADAVLRYRIYTFDASSKTVTGMSDIKMLDLNGSTNFGITGMMNRAEAVQANPTTIVAVMGTYNAYLVKFTVDTSAETVTSSVPDPIGYMNGGIHWQWMPNRNKWRLSGHGYHGTPTDDTAGVNFLGAPSTVMVSPDGTVTKFTSSLVVADTGYTYQYENGDQIGFTPSGRSVNTYSAATGVRKQLQVHNYNATSAFSMSANVNTANGAYRFIHALDDQHFVFGHAVVPGALGRRANRVIAAKPTVIALRYVEKVNDDIFIVSSNSLGVNGAAITTPNTIANDTTAYFGFTGLSVNEDFTFNLNYQFGPRLQSTRFA